MREILFRGKSKSTGEWVFGNLFDKDTKGRTHIGTTVRMCFDIDPETVGQFTGMTDKNGTKIFEGDILNEQAGSKDDICQVFWDEDRFSFSVKNGYGEYYLDDICQSICEVVGNIYDNKELLS